MAIKALASRLRNGSPVNIRSFYFSVIRRSPPTSLQLSCIAQKLLIKDRLAVVDQLLAVLGFRRLPKISREKCFTTYAWLRTPRIRLGRNVFAVVPVDSSDSLRSS